MKTVGDVCNELETVHKMLDSLDYHSTNERFATTPEGYGGIRCDELAGVLKNYSDLLRNIPIK